MGNLGLRAPKNAGSILGKTIETADEVMGVPDVGARMAGQAFGAVRKGQGLGAILGLLEKGLIHSNTPYGNKVREARSGMDAVRDTPIDFARSKLGL